LTTRYEDNNKSGFTQALGAKINTNNWGTIRVKHGETVEKNKKINIFSDRKITNPLVSTESNSTNNNNNNNNLIYKVPTFPSGNKAAPAPWEMLKNKKREIAEVKAVEPVAEKIEKEVKIVKKGPIFSEFFSKFLAENPEMKEGKVHQDLLRFIEFIISYVFEKFRHINLCS
jgi:hypothetical protein